MFGKKQKEEIEELRGKYQFKVEDNKRLAKKIEDLTKELEAEEEKTRQNQKLMEAKAEQAAGSKIGFIDFRNVCTIYYSKNRKGDNCINIDFYGEFHISYGRGYRGELLESKQPITKQFEYLSGTLFEADKAKLERWALEYKTQQMELKIQDDSSGNVVFTANE